MGKSSTNMEKCRPGTLRSLLTFYSFVLARFIPKIFALIYRRKITLQFWGPICFRAMEPPNCSRLLWLTAENVTKFSGVSWTRWKLRWQRVKMHYKPKLSRLWAKFTKFCETVKTLLSLPASLWLRMHERSLFFIKIVPYVESDNRQSVTIQSR